MGFVGTCSKNCILKKRSLTVREEMDCPRSLRAKTASLPTPGLCLRGVKAGWVVLLRRAERLAPKPSWV